MHLCVNKYTYNCMNRSELTLSQIAGKYMSTTFKIHVHKYVCTCIFKY